MQEWGGGSVGASRRGRLLRPVVLATASAALAACGGSAAAGGPRTGQSSPSSQTPQSASAAALQDAARAMEVAPSYTFAGVVDVPPEAVRVNGEFQAPDRIHEMLTPPNGVGAEVVLVGTETFVRTAPAGVWRRSTTASTITDPRTAFSVLLDAQSVSGSGGTYRFKLSSAAAHRLVAGTAPPGPGSGVALVVGDRIVTLRIDISAGGKPVTLSLNYAAIGTGPPVTVPPTTG